MRRAAASGAVLLITGAIAAQAAGAGTRRASAADVFRSASVRITLPAPGHAAVGELTVEATGTKGKAQALVVRDVNDAKLPSGIRAMAVIAPKSSTSESTTFKVYVAINNLGSPAAARSAIDNVMIMDISKEEDLGVFGRVREVPLGCRTIVPLGNVIDGNATREADGTWMYGHYEVIKLRTGQPTAAEQVMDFSIAKECPHTEGVESPESSDQAGD